MTSLRPLALLLCSLVLLPVPLALAVDPQAEVESVGPQAGAPEIAVTPRCDDPLPPIGVVDRLVDQVPADVDRPIRRLWDYGDAPDHLIGGHMPAYRVGAGTANGHFPTRGSTAHDNGNDQPGARHLVTDVAWLGNTPGSREADAAFGLDADGHNNFIGQSADHDRGDDGIMPMVVEAGATGILRFVVQARLPVQGWYANVLVDWDQDGWWEPSEWPVQNLPITAPPGASWLFSVPITAGHKVGTPWVRITLSDTPVPGPWGGLVPIGTQDRNGNKAFDCGETEDHCGIIHVTPDIHWPEDLLASRPAYTCAASLPSVPIDIDESPQERAFGCGHSLAQCAGYLVRRRAL